MTFDPKYLGSNLDRRSHKVAEDFGIAVAQIRAKAAAAGTLGGSRTYLQFIDAGLDILSREVNDAFQFAHNLTGEHDGEVANQVSHCATQMVAKIMQIARQNSSTEGGTAAEIINKMDVTLSEKKDALVEDFRHGMMGSQKLKKDPVVSIVSNQNNSPGAVQQIGVGDKFSQLAFVQNHQPLIAAVERALASPEFAKLPPEQKDGFRDVADTLLEEAAKPTPDVGKLKRWGTRLSEIALQVGMRVASEEIIHVIGKIFGA